MPKKAITDDDILRCYPVMAELRTDLSKDEFLPLIRKMEREGYRLCYHEDNGAVAAVAGYRVFTKLYKGKNLYVDDLVTHPDKRSRGLGEQLLTWLKNEAINEQCTYFNLDSGTQRYRAHRFYFKQNLIIDSYHFSEDILLTDKF
ncbi:MAG: GNAT superfamily N-acetyltransferase [Arenicella sp.]|jgi:GNAT superfamily N-acetyltransferase